MEWRHEQISREPHCRRHRFPADVIAHVVWLYFRFPLSLRIVEDLLAERGIVVLCANQGRWWKPHPSYLVTVASNTFSTVPALFESLNMPERLYVVGCHVARLDPVDCDAMSGKLICDGFRQSYECLAAV